jgi:hypothetical protein
MSTRLIMASVWLLSLSACAHDAAQQGAELRMVPDTVEILDGY